MKRNKLYPFLLLPVAVLALTACGEVDAKPSDNDDPLVVNKDGTNTKKDYANNIKNIIYDAKRDGGAVSSKVLDEVLYQISADIYGEYYDTKDGDKTIAGLKTIAKLAQTEPNSQKVKDFLTAHPVYTKREEGKTPTAEESKKEIIRLTQTAKRIEDRIAKKFFDAVGGGAFTRNGYFYEEDYLMSLRNSLKKVAPLSEATLTKKELILPDFEETEVFTAGLLHESNYQNEAKGYNYISDEIAPIVYRDLLVEQYLFKSNYATIGRSYARNVNIVTINNRADYPLAAGNLMDTYISTYINNPAAPTFAENENPFEPIATAWRGYGITNDANKAGTTAQKAAYLLKNSDAEFVEGAESHEFTGETYDYWTGTSYGTMIQDLNKVVKDPKVTDTAKENEFTNNGEYTVKQGVEVKANKVQKEDYITDGWHVRNGGLSSVNETIKDRLFNIGVANALDDEDYPDRFNNGVYCNTPEGENNYVAKINGRYYLKTGKGEKYPSTSTYSKDILWIQEGAYSLVEIKEAVSSSKLAIDGDHNYEKLASDPIEGFKKMENIAHSVAEEIAKNDSYKTLSTKYWLKDASIKFHDDTIYEYFQENYPELFE